MTHVHLPCTCNCHLSLILSMHVYETLVSQACTGGSNHISSPWNVDRQHRLTILIQSMVCHHRCTSSAPTCPSFPGLLSAWSGGPCGCCAPMMMGLSPRRRSGARWVVVEAERSCRFLQHGWLKRAAFAQVEMLLVASTQPAASAGLHNLCFGLFVFVVRVLCVWC